VTPHFRASWLLAAFALLGCTATAPAPKVSPPPPTTCKLSELPQNPSLVGWKPESRRKLAELAERGAVAVRYTKEGCSAVLEVLPGCSVSSAQYEFVPHWVVSTTATSNLDEVRAELPLSSPQEVSLRVTTNSVGSLRLPSSTVVGSSSLLGSDCARATHVVRQMSVGGFTLLAQGREMREQTLDQQGDPQACERAKTSGTLSPRCRGPLRLRLEPVVGEVVTGNPAGMVRLPGGTFLMGSKDGRSDEKPVHSVTVAAFEMDRTEVTVAAYQACVRAGRCSPADTGGGCNAGVAAKGNHPINCVDFDQAEAFCRWAGKRLPTEEEWEYAAQGTDGRKYPWGNAEPDAQLCWRLTSGAGTCPVGTYPAGNSPFGLSDMLGNVWEWTASNYSDTYEADRDRAHRVLRGGSWGDDSYVLRATSRFRGTPSYRFIHFGLRCARGLAAHRSCAPTPPSALRSTARHAAAVLRKTGPLHRPTAD
jgi:formylglycine-generating enzyme required for sulfatase activity